MRRRKEEKLSRFVRRIIFYRHLSEENNRQQMIPGEPPPYCIKYPYDLKRRPAHVYHKSMYHSMIACSFPAYKLPHVAVVAMITFYVTPSKKENRYSYEQIASEKIPATFAHELPDYLLALMEMLIGVLYSSHRQIVKMDVQKFYSKNPRTMMRYMRWEDYVSLQNNNSVLPEKQGKRASWQKPLVQPKPAEDAGNQGICQSAVQ